MFEWCFATPLYLGEHKSTGSSLSLKLLICILVTEEWKLLLVPYECKKVLDLSTGKAEMF